MENKTYPPYLKLVKNLEPESNIIPFPQKIDTAEEKAVLMLSMLGDFIQEMISSGISHRILIEGIFMRWLHIVTLSGDLPDDFLIAQLDQLGNLMMALFFKISEIEGGIPDDPEELLRILEEKAIVFSRISGIANTPARRRNLGLYVKFHNAFADLLNKFSEEGMRDEAIEETLLYCWVRAVTLMRQDPEVYFQKIDCNWPEIFDGVSEYASYLMETIYHEREETTIGNR